MITEFDPVNNRTWAIWEMCGVNFRSNTVRHGGRIPLHAHSYAHIAQCTLGWFLGKSTAPDGSTEEFQLASPEFTTDDPRFNPIGSRCLIPAGYQHSFELLGAKDVGTIECFWPKGSDQ